MGVNILETKEKVQRYLIDIVGPLQIDEKGDFSFRHGSSHIYIGLREWGDGSSIVQIYSPTNFDVPPSPELFHYIAVNTDRYTFGHLGAAEGENGVMIMFTHTLLGDFIDKEELKWALLAVAQTADQIDDEIEDEFGGRKYYEENQ